MKFLRFMFVMCTCVTLVTGCGKKKEDVKEPVKEKQNEKATLENFEFTTNSVICKIPKSTAATPLSHCRLHECRHKLDTEYGSNAEKARKLNVCFPILHTSDIALLAAKLFGYLLLG